MINPIDHQLSMWKLEQNAQNLRDPGSSAQQALQSEDALREAERRDISVQRNDESHESQRLGVGERDARQGRREGRKKEAKTEHDDDDENSAAAERGGLDLYA